MSTSKLIETINSELIPEQLNDLNTIISNEQTTKIGSELLSEQLEQLDGIELKLDEIETAIVDKLIKTISCEMVSDEFSDRNIVTSNKTDDTINNDLLSDEFNDLNIVTSNKADDKINNDLLSDEFNDLNIVTNRSNEKVERELLSEEFDEMDIETNYKYNSKYSYDEVSPNDDPADLVDIFPNLLGNENRYYPKFWY